MANHPSPPLLPTSEERAALEMWTRSRSLPHRQVLRAKIVLLAADGVASDVIAERLGCNRLTVRRWRRRFSEARVEGLEEAGGRGQKPQLSRDFVNRLVAATMEAPKDGSTHWSARLLGARFGISHSTVLRIWKDHGLQPHRTRSFKFSPDPDLVDKVTDIVGLYLHPPEKAVVLCVDEKSQIQALDRTQPLLPMRPGQVERRSHDYVRHGTTTLFAALDVATGEVTGRCYARHRHEEFLRFLQRLARVYPTQDLHLVVDNYRTHKHPVVRAWLADNPPHPPPLHADRRQLDEPGGDVVLDPAATGHRTGRLPQRACPGCRHRPLPHRLEQELAAVLVDQTRRRHPRQGEPSTYS